MDNNEIVNVYNKLLKNTYSELPEYENLVDLIEKDIEIIVRSIIEKTKQNEEFQDRLMKDEKIFSDYNSEFPYDICVLGIEGGITIEQNSDMSYKEILVNGYKLELQKDIIIKNLLYNINKCNELYDILYDKNFDYKLLNYNGKPTRKLWDAKYIVQSKISTILNTEFSHCCRSIDIYGLKCNNIKPTILQYMMFLFKKPKTKYIIKLNCKARIK